MCYWPSVVSRWLNIGQVLSCVSVRRCQYTSKSILIRTSLVKKGLIYSPKQNSFLGGRGGGGTKQEIPSGHDRPILPRSGSQSECWIRFILPAHGFSHIIIGCKNRFKVSLTKDKLLCWHEKHEQVVRTHWTSYQSSRPSTLSWIFTSQLVLVSVGPGPRS